MIRRGAILSTVTLVAALSFVLSLAETRVNEDVFHWGLIYANSYDLLLGRMPYRETYEYYGMLTSIVFATAMLLSVKSLVVIGAVAGLFYSASLVLTYGLWRRCTDAVPALCGVLAAFLVHPRIQYPWPNYIAYGFMLAGLYVLLRVRRDRLAGFLLGAAILARHSYVLIVLPALVAAWALGLLESRRVAAVGWGASAAVLPLVAFITVFGLWGDFLALSVTVNRTLLTAIGEWAAVPSTTEFARLLLHNMAFDTATLGSRADARTLAFTVTAAAATMTLLLAIAHLLMKRLGRRETPMIDADRHAALLALFALCGFSQAMHSYEVFRLATAAAVGIGLPFYLLARVPALPRLAWVPCVAAIAVLAVPTSPALLGTSNVRPDNVPARPDAVEPLRFKRWPQHMSDRYSAAQAALASLTECDVTQLINLGGDPLMSYLVPALGKPQREPSRMHWHRSDEIFPDEAARRRGLLRRGTAAVITPASVPWVPDPRLKIVHADENMQLWAPERCSGGDP
jgi:hypothetical protein